MKPYNIIIIIIIGLAGIIVIKSNSLPISDQNTSQTLVTDFPQPIENEKNRYINYSPASFAINSDKKRVLFFHASWCPTCKVANQEFTNNFNNIPIDIVVFKTDYDNESALKQKYGITYQHTFVYVDGDGDELAKWNGGAIVELIANTK